MLQWRTASVTAKNKFKQMYYIIAGEALEICMIQFNESIDRERFTGRKSGFGAAI
jgi:hypothetical protein